MIVYVHDRGIYDAGRTFGRHRRLTDVEHLLIDSSTTIPQMVRRIIARVRHRRSIWLLIFNAHGWAGRVAIGTGLDKASVHDLAPLRPCMTPGGRGAEIHACYVASAIIDPPCRYRNASCPQRHSVGVEFMRLGRRRPVIGGRARAIGPFAGKAGQQLLKMRDMASGAQMPPQPKPARLLDDRRYR